MKEIIVESLVRTTEIIKIEDDKVDATLAELKDVKVQRELANEAKEKLGMDDIQIKDVKVFVRDIPEEKKKSSKRKKSTVAAGAKVEVKE